MKELAALGAAEAAAAIRRGELSSEDLVRACLERIALQEPRIHAFRDRVAPEAALAEARDRDRTREDRPGALHGVPVAVKEIIDVANLHCGWGTPIHATRVPTNDAVVVARLRAAGAVIIGTTVSTEYAIARAGPTTNPHDPSRSPGGSSSGAAAAVAACMAPLALGTQTVGSIVRPATYCGVYGLKPTHGAISTQGVMSLSGALDHVGFLARDVDDIDLACGVLFDRNGETSGFASVPPAVSSDALAPRRAFLVEGHLRACIELASRTALERAQAALEASGASVLHTDLPAEFGEAESCLDTILWRDIAANHGADRDRAGEQMSPKLRDLVDRGRKISDEQYASAIDRARHYRASLVRLLDSDAIILAPATDGVAPPIGIEGTGSPRLQGLYTMTGLPALAVPCGMFEGLPIGVQIIANPGREGLLLAAARVMRSAFHFPTD
jgi:Asp-tRNA(Asn)/Glu-tRNA(Gln) amidotransferase A subunit family amidase